MWGNLNWNGIALLATGIATGWSLVNYLVVAENQVRGQMRRLILAIAGASLVLGLLLWSSGWRAAITGGMIFALSAVVAYAANAKQVSGGEKRSVEIVADPYEQMAPGSLRGILLISHAEPARYDGFEYWSNLINSDPELSRRSWLSKPWLYARIRRAYRTMEQGHPGARFVESLAHSLQVELGSDVRIHPVGLVGNQLAKALRALVREGCSQLDLIPLELSEADLEKLHQQVARSRVREYGVRITYHPTMSLAVLSPSAIEARSQRLFRGQRLPEIGPCKDYTEQILRMLAHSTKSPAGIHLGAVNDS